MLASSKALRFAVDDQPAPPLFFQNRNTLAFSFPGIPFLYFSVFSPLAFFTLKDPCPLLLVDSYPVNQEHPLATKTNSLGTGWLSKPCVHLQTTFGTCDMFAWCMVFACSKKNRLFYLNKRQMPTQTSSPTSP